MAKYSGSLFGKISGKAKDSVASTWKGIKYIREHVIPQNPKTPAQTLQRDKFANISGFGRRIVDTILNPHTIPAPKKKSAYNVFVGNNVPLQSTGVLDLSEVELVKGGLYQPGIDSIEFTLPNGITLDYATDNFGEAQASDLSFGVVYDRVADKINIGELTRGAGSVTVNNGRVPNTDNEFDCWLYFVSADNKRVSDSNYDLFIMPA